MATEIRAIVLHKRPHGDEILAVWILMNAFAYAAENLFPGITTARIIFVDAGTVFSHPTADEMEQQGILCIGVGGGRFDEHPHGKKARQKGECAATLIAAELGVDYDSLLKPLLDYATRVDLEGKDDPFDLFNLIKTLQLEAKTDQEMTNVILWSVAALNAWWAWRQNPRGFYNENMLQLFGLIMTEEHQKNAQIAKHFTQCLSGGFHPFSLGRLAYLVSLYPSLGPNSVFGQDLGVFERGIVYARMWANRVLNAKAKEQVDFDRGRSEISRPVLYEEIQGRHGSCGLVVVASNNYQVWRAARNSLRNILGALVQIRSTGHVQIFFNRNHPRFSGPNNAGRIDRCAQVLAHNIRLAELECRGIKPPFSGTSLYAEGQVAGAHMWHFFLSGHMVMNGTATSPNKEATAIPIDQIVIIVRKVLETYMEL